MPEESFLAWLVVIGRDDKHSIDPHFFGGARGGDGSIGGIGTSPSEDLAMSLRDFAGDANHLFAFGRGKRRRFAGRADGNHAAYAVRDLILNQRFERGDIDLTVAE